jgi:large subunit ribosomal protein L9
MRVLLLKDVPELGKAGQLKTVADGYGRNFLLPRRLAEIATEGAIRQAEVMRKADDRRSAKVQSEAEKVAAELSGMTVHFTAKSGEQGKLYGSITSAQVAEALTKKSGLEIDKRKLDLEEPLKELGLFDVRIKLAPGVDTVIKVVIESEE